MGLIIQGTDGWINELGSDLLFNSISVISGLWVDDHGRLCAMEPSPVDKISTRAGLEPGIARSVSQHLTQ